VKHQFLLVSLLLKSFTVKTISCPKIQFRIFDIQGICCGEKRRVKISKVESEAVIQGRADNTITERE
jgi:hypothetical protein